MRKVFLVSVLTVVFISGYAFLKPFRNRIVVKLIKFNYYDGMKGA
jgi:hypothetical protein